MFISSDGMVQTEGKDWRHLDTVQRGDIRATLPFDKDGHAKGTEDGESKEVYHDLHRLTAFAFLGPPPEGKTDVHDIDENKLNNSPTNLMRVSRKYNMTISYANGYNALPGKKEG